ncbi:MAG: hypothetical protein ACT4P4_24390 [Betaproteobacteria bacterium]
MEAFKRTLVSARAVAYPGEGESGKYFVSVVERLGIMADMKPRQRPMPAEYNVEGLATGEFDLVLVVASRIAGGIPQELQAWRPAAEPVLRAAGVEPFVE